MVQGGYSSQGVGLIGFSGLGGINLRSVWGSTFRLPRLQGLQSRVRA